MKHASAVRVLVFFLSAGIALLTSLASAGVVLGAQERPEGPGFSFRTGVSLVNIPVTVVDANGRFVPNLRADDFLIYEDGRPQTIEQFDVERVPVSLGIALDTSGSMLGEKLDAARAALNRFLFDLLAPGDEVFLYRFDSRPSLVHDWTEDRARVARALGSVKPSGGTALYDTITVVDANGRFVPNLRADDFLIYEDGRPQTIEQFDVERVPVSLGIALDTSGSMLGEKLDAARAALNRFLFDLLAPGDEVFLYRFDSRPSLVHDWTEDRARVARALGSVKPSGGTALYDTIAEAVPLAQAGTRRKKALVLISDGNDTSSRARAEEILALIRRTELLVYAIGIDASDGLSGSGSAGPRLLPQPSPFPGRAPAPVHVPRQTSASIDRVNPDALRAITDETGGRTEIIVSAQDLASATAGIADELSRQYFLAYTSAAPRDGRWHTIDVQLRRPGSHVVRARRGFTAN